METITKFKNFAVLSPLVLTTLPGTVLSGEHHPYSLNFQPGTQVGEAVSFDPVKNLGVQVGDAPAENNIQMVTLTEPATEWTKKMERRFDELAELEAFGTLSSEQAKELESLVATRRNLLYARTAEEILWEYEQTQITAKLVSAVEEYVKFHEGPHHAGQSARAKDTKKQVSPGAS